VVIGYEVIERGFCSSSIKADKPTTKGSDPLLFKRRRGLDIRGFGAGQDECLAFMLYSSHPYSVVCSTQ
jgi:hypothetical protein